MKAIIYAGISLFSAASVYGVVDYYATKKTGTLNKLYKEEVPVAPPKQQPINTVAVELPIKNEVDKPIDTKVGVKKTSTTKAIKKSPPPVRKIKFSDFSRGRIIPKKVVEVEKTIDPVVEKEN